jgi:hypothetical protein
MATVNGTAVNFGYTGSNGIAITGVSGTLLQSAEHSKEADVEMARNGVGDGVARGWYDQRDTATLEWIVTGSSLSNAITNTSLSAVAPGTIIVITACASDTDLVATNWEVQSSKVVGSNTTFKKIVCVVNKRSGITAVAT